MDTDKIYVYQNLLTVHAVLSNDELRIKLLSLIKTELDKEGK